MRGVALRSVLLSCTPLTRPFDSLRSLSATLSRGLPRERDAPDDLT
jgi:hypothetical protein